MLLEQAERLCQSKADSLKSELQNKIEHDNKLKRRKSEINRRRIKSDRRKSLPR